jgi:hypothetical protein
LHGQALPQDFLLDLFAELDFDLMGEGYCYCLRALHATSGASVTA